LKRIILALALALTMLVAAVSAPAMSEPKLNAVVGPGFNISLKKGKSNVSKLKAGTYTIVVADKAKTHNFHLKGPGVDKKTSVGKKQTKSWTLKLKKGKYTFVCDPHKSFMKGSFTVS
jgi:plastocyanin